MSTTQPITAQDETLPMEEMSIEDLRAVVERLQSDNAAMRPIVLRMAEARMCRDAVTMIESCPHCSLRRGGVFGYSGVHDERCVVSQARRLGF